MEKEKALDSKARIEEFLKSVSLTLIQSNCQLFPVCCFVLYDLVSATENMSYCSIQGPVLLLLYWLGIISVNSYYVNSY